MTSSNPVSKLALLFVGVAREDMRELVAVDAVSFASLARMELQRCPSAENFGVRKAPSGVWAVDTNDESVSVGNDLISDARAIEFVGEVAAPARAWLLNWTISAIDDDEIAGRPVLPQGSNLYEDAMVDMIQTSIVRL